MLSLTEAARLLGVSDRLVRKELRCGHLRGALKTITGGMRVWEITQDDAIAWKVASFRASPGNALQRDPKAPLVELAARIGRTPSVADLQAARLVSVKSLSEWWGSYREVCRSLGLPDTRTEPRWRPRRTWTDGELLAIALSGRRWPRRKSGP